MKMTKVEKLIVGVTFAILVLLVCYCVFSAKDNRKEETTQETTTEEITTTEEVTTEKITTEKVTVTTTEAITEEVTTEEITTTEEEEIYTEQYSTEFVEKSAPITEEETTAEVASNTDAATETETTTEEEVIQYDIPWIVYEVVECEVHGGDKESKMHVAHVIRNRVWSDLFPDDYYSVCASPNQFCWRSDVEQSTIDAVNEAMTIADTTDGALFFHSMDWMSSWGGYEYKFTDNVGHHFY